MFYSDFTIIIGPHIDYIMSNGIQDNYLDILPDLLQDMNVPNWKRLHEIFLYMWCNNKKPKSHETSFRGTTFHWSSVSKSFSDASENHIKYTPILFGSSSEGMGSLPSPSYTSIREAYLAAIYAYYME